MSLIRSGYRLSRNLTAVSFGVFLVLAGILFILYPLAEEFRAFFSDLTLTPLFDHVYYPAPISPHPLFYHILRNFSAVWATWLGLVTVIQLAIRDRPRRVAHTFGDCIFWIGAAILLDKIALGFLSFGSFISLMIVVTGLSLIARALTVMVVEKAWC